MQGSPVRSRPAQHQPHLVPTLRPNGSAHAQLRVRRLTQLGEFAMRTRELKGQSEKELKNKLGTWEGPVNACHVST
jgi:hypothetical protein